jgi:lipoprotein-anchoring transpeptidase ErfK/SrfK
MTYTKAVKAIKNTNIRKKRTGNVLLIIGIVALFIGIFLVVWIQYFNAHIAPGTYLAGLKIGSENRTSAMSIAGKQFEKSKVELILFDGESEGKVSSPAALSPRELGISIDSERTTDAVMSVSAESDIKRLNPFNRKDVDIVLVCDEEVLKSRLEEAFPDTFISMKEPKVKYNKDTGKFKVRKGRSGKTVDTDRLIGSIGQKVLSGQPETIKIDTMETPPQNSNDDAKAVAKQLNAMQKAIIHIRYDGQTLYTIPQETIVSWISAAADAGKQGKLTPKINTEKIETFLSEKLPGYVNKDVTDKIVHTYSEDEETDKTSDNKADSKDKTSKDKTSKDTTSDEKTSDEESIKGTGSDEKSSAEKDSDAKSSKVKTLIIQNGEAGRRLTDTSGIAEQIANAVSGGREVNVEPVFTKLEYETKNVKDTGENWIEVDLSDQKTMLWTGDQNVETFTVSTGKDVTPTISGTFKIVRKLDDHTMVGGDKAKGTDYATPHVRYISYFKGGYAFHAAYWHNAFGVQVSHGCVNLRTAEAKILYDFAPIGTKVVIHK